MKRTEEMKIIEIDKLIPYAKNARTHSKEQILKLRSSLREFGFVNPVLIDKDNNIIAGHGRIIAAKEEGINEVPCVLVEHLSDAQKRAYILADNRLAMDAGWDSELLALEFENLKELNFDISLTGFEAAEIDELFSNIHDKDVSDDDFDVEAALPEDPISKSGDLWLLGRHRLLCGDSTDPETYKIIMDGKKANLVVTDPPYNIDITGGTKDKLKIKNDSMPDKDFYEFLYKFYKCTFDVMDDGAAIYVFHADTEGINFRTALKNAGFHLSGVCIWVKNSLVLGRMDYHFRHEPILYAWKPTGKHKWYTDRKQNTIWEFDRPKRSEFHPTTKPLPLVAYPIKNSSMTNCVVLDPFAGSFSTGIACEQTNRICYAIELDPKYVDVCVARYLEHTKNPDSIQLIREGEALSYNDVQSVSSKAEE